MIHLWSCIDRSRNQHKNIPVTSCRLAFCWLSNFHPSKIKWMCVETSPTHLSRTTPQSAIITGTANTTWSCQNLVKLVMILCLLWARAMWHRVNEWLTSRRAPARSTSAAQVLETVQIRKTFSPIVRDEVRHLSDWWRIVIRAILNRST